MELDRNGLEVLTRSECLAALTSAPVGRVGLSIQALPVIVPVNFVVDGDDIIIRSTDGARTESALAGSVVAFEIDGFEGSGDACWSVLVRGRSRFVDDPGEVARLHALWQRSWGTTWPDRWVAISMEVVTGRRVSHGEDQGGSDQAGVADRGPAGVVRETSTILAWSAWGAVRADHHATAADPRTVAAPPHLSWPSRGDDEVAPVEPDR